MLYNVRDNAETFKHGPIGMEFPSGLGTISADFHNCCVGLISLSTNGNIAPYLAVLQSVSDGSKYKQARTRKCSRPYITSHQQTFSASRLKAPHQRRRHSL